MAAERTLKDDQCGVCGCYCFGSPPYPWKVRQTPKGKIQICDSCDEQYSGVADPVKASRIARVSAKLAKAERCAAKAERLEEELDRLI